MSSTTAKMVISISVSLIWALLMGCAAPVVEIGSDLSDTDESGEHESDIEEDTDTTDSQQDEGDEDDGDDGDDCQTATTACATVDGPLSKSGFLAGDTVLVATGTYTETSDQVALLNETVRLLGGWDGAFATQSGASTIDGEDARRRITVDTGATALMERFVVQNGQPTPGQGGGGGVRAGRGLPARPAAQPLLDRLGRVDQGRQGIHQPRLPRGHRGRPMSPPAPAPSIQLRSS